MSEEIKKPYSDHILGIENEEKTSIAPGVDAIFKVAYNDDNHGEENVAYTTVTLWDNYNRKEIDYSSTEDFALNDDGTFRDPESVLKAQNELVDSLVDGNHHEIDTVSSAYSSRSFSEPSM